MNIREKPDVIKNTSTPPDELILQFFSDIASGEKNAVLSAIKEHPELLHIEIGEKSIYPAYSQSTKATLFTQPNLTSISDEKEEDLDHDFNNEDDFHPE